MNGLQTIHAGQLEIHQRHVRPVLDEPLDGLFSGGRFGDNCQGRVEADDQHDPLAHEAVIVDAHDADRRHRSLVNVLTHDQIGETVVTTVP